MRIALRAAAAVAWLLLVAPPLALLVFSLNPGAAQGTPSWGISLRAYAALLEPSRLLSALGTSLLLGALATGAALALGIPAALALRRGRIPGRAALMAFLLSPAEPSGHRLRRRAAGEQRRVVPEFGDPVDRNRAPAVRGAPRLHDPLGDAQRVGLAGVAGSGDRGTGAEPRGGPARHPPLRDAARRPRRSRRRRPGGVRALVRDLRHFPPALRREDRDPAGGALRGGAARPPDRRWPPTAASPSPSPPPPPS